MRKALVMFLLMLGITFIFNPETNVGYVYLNNAPQNFIILVDSHSNVLRYYQGVPAGEVRLDQGFDFWLRDMISKGMPFKSIIVPYRQQPQQQQQDKEYYQKRIP